MKVKEETEKVGLKLNFRKQRSWQIDGETMELVIALLSWAPKSLLMVTVAMKLKDACSLVDSYDQPRWHIKKQRHYFANKGPSSQSYGFPVVMCGCES